MELFCNVLKIGILNFIKNDKLFFKFNWSYILLYIVAFLNFIHTISKIKLKNENNYM